jgi:hypothetical protein
MAPATTTIAPPPIHQSYGVTPPPQTAYQAPQSSRPSYAKAPPVQQPPYNPPPPPQVYAPPPPQQPVYQQPHQTAGYQNVNGLQRGQSATGAYYPNGQHQQATNQLLHPQQTQTQTPYGYHDQGPAGRTPSPAAIAPTGQTTEEGVPILFYGAFFSLS